AQAYASLDEPLSRSILFLAVTAEEKGLLGSAYYAANPVYPRNKTVAAINMDGLNADGRTNDITVIGYGASELDDYLETAAAAQNRVIRADPEPEKGFYYRSDHFSFAKQGIPALYTDAGIDHVEHGERWTLARRDEYTADRYHKPTDEFDPSWDFSGAVDDLRVLLSIGLRLANESTFPNWRMGNEFRAIRDADMARESGVELRD
ncbi:MAG: M28 family peptidase, partial [Gemmatimonadetes bacterium]|nr:M28 family peptidase [Gemmatimonadota bacterium]